MAREQELEPLRGGMTILYVDDDELARKYFEHAAGGDYRVLSAPGVDAALLLLAALEGEVDVLVTDYRMPGKSGGELLRAVERDYPHIVRILVTAHADRDVLLEMINSRTLFRILEKPLDMEQVLAILRQACDAARERAARRHGLLAIEETVAFLAHELNTPLAAVANFSRGIQRRTNAAEAPELPLAEIGAAAALINDNARYCMSVLATFVDSVRQANATPGLRGGRAASSARLLVASLLDAYPMTALQRAAVQLDVQQDFPVIASPNCVALVLSSVLHNALRALDGHAAPSLRFTISLARIRISDNGPGIPPEILQRLLVDPVTMHEQAGGSGWGMIFCNRVMQSFGGNIQVETEQGQSTTVTLNFPVHIRNEHD